MLPAREPVCTRIEGWKRGGDITGKVSALFSHPCFLSRSSAMENNGATIEEDSLNTTADITYPTEQPGSPTASSKKRKEDRQRIRVSRACDRCKRYTV